MSDYSDFGHRRDILLSQGGWPTDKTPDPQPPAAPETDESASDRVQRFLDERARPTLFAPRGFLPVDFLAEITRTGDVLLVSDLRALLADLDAARERVREVEGERDAALDRYTEREGRWHWNLIREGNAIAAATEATARAESAEAAHEALRAGVEALADEWERTHLTGFCSGGCDYIGRGNRERFVSDLRALLAGDAR